MYPKNGRQRVVIEHVTPEVDAGRFAVKRVVGEQVVVEADAFADGHDSLSLRLRYRAEEDKRWTEIAMDSVGNDRWRASFPVTIQGYYRYTVTGWVDHFATWRRDFIKKHDAGQDIQVEMLIGAKLMEDAAGRAKGKDKDTLSASVRAVGAQTIDVSERVREALNPVTEAVMAKYPDREFATTYDQELRVICQRIQARFSTWYEMFPRSCSGTAGQHGTFRDCETRLPYIASMGFDVLYLPPIHPIGKTHRKGKNNSPTSEATDPGSPWAIGAIEGGHKAIHAPLGTLQDLKHFIEQARAHGLEVAMDIAFQCAPDHPYVKEHRSWFRIRPDGTVQYAENPPKKYQDIVPLEFENGDWEELWNELKSVIDYWIGQDVRIFRVDNPHTKPFAFWEWLIERIHQSHPDVIFLSEAFTRPKIMYRLAKLGFTQSYNYFPWRTTKAELTEYFTELTQTPVREFFRPNVWPNTPDILTEQLQQGGRPAFMARLILAATLGASYGIYGPAFELGEHVPFKPGSEEYLNSEKYEIKHWDLEQATSLRELIGLVNRIRRENPALQSDWSLRFHQIPNDQLLCYSKRSPDKSNMILVVVNLSHQDVHSGWVELDLDELGLEGGYPFEVEDLLTNERYVWQGPRNYVSLNPHSIPAHIFRVHRPVTLQATIDKSR
ncbi:Alpha-1,4-glucan:maltose-1-phosphate maltosyltransferase [Nitrospira sp. KM1]|uniref:alpha-1,4-glucan--maltose-1-phosphate maltosyltransferase n=1 Tax=Nitrospira sp. KM1 TaxID=1936990 RepID=UPI0013A7AB47|nr:alpha-1,4-glucan--maltose-1-phosphate maltosyltransferase [Nitrospira sp. KM1]BCA55610.1 Alpha-1,4-glucan:maltose-1-phosphate maltosyltransferase [Nitrospira sp. KM1]